MASIAENISNLSIDEGAEILKMHTYGLKVKGVKQVLKRRRKLTKGGGTRRKLKTFKVQG